MPELLPVTAPLDGLTEATAPSEPAHVPTPVEVLSVMVDATHTADAPVIGDGNASTVIGRVT